MPFETRLAGQAQVKMNYSDAAELDLALAWTAMSPHAQVVTIGHSIDYKTAARPAIYPIKAVRITGSRNSTSTDDNRKNAILFECGMHPREWLTTESCWSLVMHLVNHAEDQATDVPELLANVDVWIVPLTTVAGRVIDDRAHGDPESFDRSVSSAGWRGNGDTRGGCAAGVNVARNFSAGWADEDQDDCAGDAIGNYRGFAPFSTLEATALRQFVQNHSISMAVVVHSNATKIWNLWGAADVGGSMIRSLAALSWGINLDDDRHALAEASVGNGLGQFSAWMAGSSNTAGEPDNGSARNIQTIFIELPFLDSAPANAYSTGIYRFDPADNSNGFHPSSNNVRTVIRNNFLLMAEELMREARSPGCSMLGSCPAQDFGLVGGKIGRSSLSAGSIQSYASGCIGWLDNGICRSGLVRARDYLAPGAYYVDYRVQNFSTVSVNNGVRATVQVTGTDSNGNAIAAVSTQQDFLDLELREARTGRAAIDLGRVGADYTITVTLSPRFQGRDTFANNDTKVFKVRTR